LRGGNDDDDHGHDGSVPSAALRRDDSVDRSGGKVLSGQIPPATAPTQALAKYHFVTEYTMLGPQGMEMGTHVLSADFTADANSVAWTTVTVGPSSGHGNAPTAAEHRPYVEGFKYERDAKKSHRPISSPSSRGRNR
jgi:hypothetical protein